MSDEVMQITQADLDALWICCRMELPCWTNQQRYAAQRRVQPLMEAGKITTPGLDGLPILKGLSNDQQDL